MEKRGAAILTSALRGAVVVIRDGMGLAGIGSIAYGAWLAWPPAGFMVGGGMLFAAAVLLSRR